MTGKPSSNRRLSPGDPSWRTCPQTWGVSTTATKKILHRIKAVATPEGSAFNHGLTECGVYLLRVGLHFEAPEEAEECDACLFGDTQYHVVYVYVYAQPASARCVYVGSSSDLLTRLQHHVREPWWTPHLVLTYTVYESSDAASEAEVATILDRKPSFNYRPKAGGRRTGASSMATLHVDYEELARLVSETFGVTAHALPNLECAQLIGCSENTYWRIKTDPNYGVSGGFVAQLITAFGVEALPGLLHVKGLRPLRVAS
jgi:hypothetical protein